MSDDVVLSRFARTLLGPLVLAVLTGCAVPSAPLRQDPFAGLGLDPPAYPALSLALVMSENTKNAVAYGQQGAAFAPFDMRRILEEDIGVFKRNFKSVARFETFEEARKLGSDLVAVLDVHVEVGRRLQFDKSAVFFSLDRKEVDTVSGRLEQGNAAMSPAAAGKAVQAASTEAAARLEAAIRGSVKLAAFAAERAAVAPAAAVAAVPPPAARSSDVDRPSFRMPERPEDFALIVGVEGYASLPAAQFAERDAAAVREHLRALGVPERNLVYLTGSQAGKAGLEKYLASWLPKNVGPRSRVFFYFSGHGAPDPATGEAYLVPWDGDPKFLADTAVPLRSLYARLEALPAERVILALDACFSGAGGRSVLPQGARPLVSKVEPSAGAAGKLVVLSAAAGDEITGTDEAQGHGLFTYHLLKGWGGAAKDAAGRVTSGALLGYLKPRVQDGARRQNRDQTPALAGAPDVELAAFGR